MTRAPSIAQPIVSMRHVGAIAVLCAAGALALVPKRSELYERLVRDGDQARALELAAAERQAAADAVAQAQELPPDEIIATAFADPAALTGLNTDPAARARLVDALARSADLEASYKQLVDHAGSLQSAACDELLRALADTALAHNQPELAARFYAEFLRAHPETSPALAAQMVRSFRFNGQPAQALAYLSSWIDARDGAAIDVPADLRLLHVNLLLENNRPRPAFDAVKALWEREAAVGAVSEATVDLAVKIAGYADRSGDLRPLLAAWVNAQPLGQATWEDVRDAARTPGSALLAGRDSFLRWGHLTAQWSEWNDEPQAAFDLYRRLAVLGDAHALGRCEDLWPGLSMQLSWMELLRVVVPVPDKPDYTLALARQLGLAAEYDEAEHWYHAWLSTHPADVDAFIELAALREERGDFEEALATYLRASQEQPDHLVLRKKIAALSIELRRFPVALRVYEGLTPEEHDPVTLENFALIAESTAKYADLRRALELRLPHLKPPKPADYIDLARACRLMDEEDDAMTVLERGLRALPGSQPLVLELASAYREADRLEEALTLLERPETRTSLEATALYIESACQLDAYDRALAFLGRGFERRFAFSDDTKLDAGHIYFNTGNAAEANALYSTVSSDPATWPVLALARQRLGDYAGAEAFQRRHLAAVTAPDPEGWIMLGDLCRQQGREADARSAYDHALALMKQKLPDTSPAVPQVGSVDSVSVNR